MEKKLTFYSKQWVSLVIGLLVIALVIVLIFAFRKQLSSSAAFMPAPTPTPSKCPTANFFFSPEDAATRRSIADVVGKSKDYYYCPTTQTYKDIPPSDPSYCRIEALTRSGIVTPCREDSTGKYFCPDDHLDRSQTATIIARDLAGSDALVPDGPATPSFTDVPTSSLAYKYIEYLKSKGVVSGYGDGTFRPAKNADRATLAVMLARARNRIANPIYPTFQDVPKDHWAYKEIEGIYLTGWMTGMCKQALLTLVPSKGTFSSGSTFKATINLTTANQYASGADALLTYNPSELEVQDADSNTAGVQVNIGSIFPNYPSNRVDPSTGKIMISGIVNPGSPSYACFKGTGTFATITFKVLKNTGTYTNVKFNFTPGATNDSNIASADFPGKDLLNNVVNGSYYLAKLPTPIPTGWPTPMRIMQ